MKDSHGFIIGLSEINLIENADVICLRVALLQPSTCFIDPKTKHFLIGQILLGLSTLTLPAYA